MCRNVQYAIDAVQADSALCVHQTRESDMQVVSKTTERRVRHMTVILANGKERSYYSVRTGWVSEDGIDCASSFDRELNKAWRS